MEHDLLIVETGVDGLRPRLAVSDIQAAPESGEVEMEREREEEFTVERSRRGGKQREEEREKKWHPKTRGDTAARTNKAALGAEHQSAHQ